MLIAWTTLALLVLLFGYYAAAAWYLPRGAGPDSLAHFDVARFIYDNGRLARFPEDADRLKFTPYGTTRATRPPLSYMVSAALARALQRDGDLIKELRLGSGLLCALAAAMTFLGLWLLYERYWLALGGALLFGLLPQLAFIAAYTNDDSGAIFSATALVLSMILLLRNGLTVGTGAVFGLSIGLVLLSKYTAWLLLPLAGCFVVPYLWRLRAGSIKFIAVIALCAVVGGGWWALSNMARYGLDDPLMFGVASELIETRASIPNPEQRGYLSRGIGVVDLVLRNHMNFIGESFKSTIGNLDWLRLRLGWPQYLLYLIVFVTALAYVPLHLAAGWVARLRGEPRSEAASVTFLYLILLLMILFQVVMYVRFNLYHDVQVQGKYILPALFPVLILFAAALKALNDRVAERVRFPEAAVKPMLLVAAFAVILGSHVHALTRYVIPYYYQNPYAFRTSDFHYLDLRDLDFLKSSHQLELETAEGGLALRSLGRDPQLLLKARYCKWLGANSILHVVLDAERGGTFKIYIDEGQGFNEDASYALRYAAGSNHLILPFGIHGCRRIRLDPATEAAHLAVERIGFASMQILEN